MKEKENLITIKNYAKKKDVTTSYIYKLIKEKKMESVRIDGVQFIDAVRYERMPVKEDKK